MTSKHWTIVAAMCLSAICVAAHAAPQAALVSHAYSAARAIKASRHDVSPPLRDTRWYLPPLMREVVQNRNPSRDRMRELRRKLIASGLLQPAPRQSSSSVVTQPVINPRRGAQDTVLQARAGQSPSGSFATPILNFDGLGYADAASVGEPIEYTPPDANTAVGLKYAVEVVNLLYAVYDKSDGSRVLGPIPLADLWAGFGGNCGGRYTNLRHPAVIFDQLAQRWVISVATPYNSSYCIAVSETADPTGAYYRYEFDGLPPQYSTIQSNKMGLWPNSYLATVDTTNYRGSFENFLALDRNAMLQGGRATLLLWNLPKTAGAYADLPATLDGFTLPPAGAPALFANYSSPNLFGARAPYALDLWKLTLDWSNPGASLLNGPYPITVPPFNDMLCGNNKNCIPQPAPGELLDAVSDRLMYPLAYRNLGDREALVTNQTVSASTTAAPPAGIRWYELDTSAPGAGDWSLNQSGTFDPADGKSRWVGSLAMDASGNMALGYSVSGPDSAPSVAYTGRKAGDTAGKMTEPETTLIAGGGVQQSSGEAWGAFSAMAVDPANGCTFWYTNEYYPATGMYRWNTRIGAFSFSGCEPVATGSLQGTVTDAASGAAISGAEIVLHPDFVTTYSDASGQYQYTLLPGEYTATVIDFGYAPTTARITVTAGAVAQEDFALQAAPTATLSGHVTDGGHGYGLYAEVKVIAQGVGQVADMWTDPSTGAYSVALPAGLQYTLNASAFADGYQPANGAVVTLRGDTVHDFSLTVGPTCSAPGYAVSSGFSQDFNGRFPPAGWTIANYISGSPVAWNTNTYWGDPNWTGGTGMSADMNSSAATTETGYTGRFDAGLASPPIPVSVISANPVLQFRASYANFDNRDQMYLYIRDVNGGSYRQILRWNGSVGTPFSLPGHTERLNLSAYVPSGAKAIQLLWRYLFTGGGDAWYAQVDDVAVGACRPVDGGLVSGRITDANTGDGATKASLRDDRGDIAMLINNPADSALPSGTYVIFSPAGKRTLIASAPGYAAGYADVTVGSGTTTAQDFALGAGKLAPAPGTVDIHVPVDGRLSKTLKIDNVGSAVARYRVVSLNAAPVPVSATGPFAESPNYIRDSATAKRLRAPSAMFGSREQSAAPSPIPSASTAAGSVISVFPTGLSDFYGLGVDRDRGDLWLGNPAIIPSPIPVASVDDDDIRFLFDGSNTGDRMSVVNPSVVYMADMAYDDITGMLWQVSVDMPPTPTALINYSHIYELDPKTLAPTGKSISIPSAQAERGLAFDPISGTWYAGDFSSQAIYHFDASGRLLDSAYVGLPIIGLAYNPGSGHLFVLTSGNATNLRAVYVLDANNGYAQVAAFNIPGFSPAVSGAGLDYDCAGHLWVSDVVDKEVYEVASGENGWCAIKHIPWLTVAPVAGTLPAGAEVSVTLSFNGAGQRAFTTSQAQLKLAGTTPYGVRTIPVTVHWEPEPVDLKLTGSAAPSPVRKGEALAYTLAVANGTAAGHGAASETTLTAMLPAGASYVSASGAGVSCSAASPDSGASAPELVSCDLGTLARGVSKTVTIAVKAQAAGTLTSDFSVTAREPNDSGENTLELSTGVIGDADIGVSAEGTKLTTGSSGAVHLTVSNAGPDTATGVTFRVSGGAAGIKLQSASSDQGQCAPVSGNGFECDFGDVAADGQVGVDVTVFGSYAGEATITAKAATTANDDDTANDSTTATVTVEAAKSGCENGNCGGSDGGGGGAFSGFALLALLALAFIALIVRSGMFAKTASIFNESRGIMISARKMFVPGGLVLLAGLVAGTVLYSPLAQAKAAGAKSGARAGLTPSSLTMARRDLSPSGFTTLSLQSVPALLKKAAMLGVHAPTAKIRLTVSLKLRNASELDQFLQELNNPRSRQYHQFLTPEEFTERYGPTAADVSSVEKYLKRYGIAVTDVSPNRLLIHTEGTTVAYENALGVQINDYSLGGRQFFSTADRPKLPAAIADAVQNIIGLNNAVRMHAMSHLKPLAPRRGVTPKGQASVNASAPPPQTSAYYNPMQIATAYDWPSITDRDDGAGVTIAILTALSSNIQADDYEGFWSAFGLPDHAVNIIKVDGDQNQDQGLGETLLDMEWSGAMAPGAALEVYVGADAQLSTFIDVYNQFVTDGNAQVMTTSWGAPEAAWGTLAQTADSIFKEAATQGISMFAAAGDHGSGDGTGFANMADFPSVDPYITAANGTELRADANGNYLSERAWSDTGGAISQIFSEPRWQTGPGVPENGWRNNSDLSMNAGPAWPYLFLYYGQWSAVWGTSAVAPQLAALFAVGVWQHDGSSLGQSNELIYADVNAGANNYASDFRDVTTGSNGAYDAGPNWDHPTGWGSPRASSLLAHLGVQGPVGTLRGIVTDAASGAPIANARVVVTPNNISRVTRSDGSYLILLAPGTYTVTVTDYGYKTATASVTIADGNTSEQNFSLHAAPTATISGKVTDGSGHGYALYAEVKVTSPGFGVIADVWTDPATGGYSLSLPQGFDYAFNVAAALNGYNPGTWAVSDLDGNQTHDFALTISAACTAPGYRFAQGFGADFNARVPPQGWTVTSVSQVGWVQTHGGFGFNNLPNYTGGSGEGAVANAGGTLIQNHPFDAQLITPPIPVTSLPPSSLLSFLVNYQHTLNDALDIDISGDGGQTWTTMAHLVTSYGGFKRAPGDAYTINLGDYIPAGATDIELRWRYVNPVNYIGNYAEVDDVSIGACETLDGGLVLGQVADANTGNGIVGAIVTDDRGDRVKTVANPADPDLPIGEYMVFVPAGQRSISVSDYNYSDGTATVNVNSNAVLTQNFALASGQLTPNPASLDVDAMVDKTMTETLTVSNTGSAATRFAVRKINRPVSAPDALATAFGGPVPTHVNGRDVLALSAGDVVPGSGLKMPLAQPTASPASQTAGAVIATFRAALPVYGLGVNHDAADLWLGSPVTNGGDDKDHRFLFDGTDTGDTINVVFPDVLYMADMAYDDNTGMLWQLSISNSGSCLHELDPVTDQPTGKKLCPNFPLSQRGLAYDPVGNTWITGDFTSKALYQVNSQGRILGSKTLGIPIQGLAYNPGTGHLFVLTSGGDHAVYVYNAVNGFLDKPTYLDIPGFNPQNAGAGFGYDCNGHLWISDFVDNEIFEVASGEKGWCAIKRIPWLSMAPAAGTLAAGKEAAVTLTINGAGQQAFTTSQVQLKLSGTTPYPVVTVPVTVHWQPEPVDLVLSGSAAPARVRKGGSVIYNLMVANGTEPGHGAASDAELTYELPPGTSYVSASGAEVSCTAPADSAPAPSEATSAPGMVSCDLGALAQGVSRTVTIAIRANEAGTLKSHFEVAAREPNDSGKGSLDVSTTVVGEADLATSAEGGSLATGGTGTLHFAISNHGPDAATNVVLDLKAGGAVKLQSATWSSSKRAGTCTMGANGLVCDLGEMASGLQDAVNISAFGLYAGTATVTAQVTTSAEDTNSANNLSTIQVTVKGASQGGGSGDSSGGGALGWLVLSGLLTLVLAGVYVRRKA